MTTYNATPSSNLQTLTNALLPGDILILAPGTYNITTWTIAVNGTAANPITIRSQKPVTIFAPETGKTSAIMTPNYTNQANGVKITGSYIHFEGFWMQGGYDGIAISGASHCRIWNLVIASANTVAWAGALIRISNNSHHIIVGWIYCQQVGDTSTVYVWRNALLIGTPSASWTNANTPDATNNISVEYIQSRSMYACILIYEGVRNVRTTGICAGPGQSAPVNPNGEGYCISSGNNVQISYFETTDCMKNTFVFFKKVVGGVTYGGGQSIVGGQIKWPSTSDKNIPYIISDLNDFQVFGRINSFGTITTFDDPEGFHSGYLATTMADANGSNWKKIIQAPSLATKLIIETPAKYFTLNPLPYGQTRMWQNIPAYSRTTANYGEFLTGPGATAPLSKSGEYELLEDGWLVGMAYAPSVSDQNTTFMPTVMVLHDVQKQNDQGYYWFFPTTGEQLFDPEFPPEEDPGTRLLRIQDWQNEKLRVPDSSRALTWGAVDNGWRYCSFTTPLFFPAKYNYVIAVGFPTGIGYETGWRGEGFNYRDWSPWYYGEGDQDGFTRYPIHMPTTTMVNSVLEFNRLGYTHYGTLGFGQAYEGGFGVDPYWPDGVKWGFLGDTYLGVPMPEPIFQYGRVTPITRTIGPDDDLQQALDTSIPGDTIIISGLHKGDFVVKQSGKPNQPIIIKGDGTAVIQSPWGETHFISAMRCIASNIYFYNIVFEHAAHGLVIENGVLGVKIESCTARYTRDEGFVAQESSSGLYFKNCTTTDTGLIGYYGEGIRIGRPGGYWAADSVPDACSSIIVENCTVVRSYGNGITFHDGCTDIVVTGCSVNYTTPGGNVPPLSNVSGESGYWSRADGIQFVSCTVIGAPGPGFAIWDSLWSNLTYGRGQEIKGGSSTNAGDAGVVSQSDDLKVYTDFTSTGPNGRTREIEGGWSAAGANVATTAFRPRVTNPASHSFGQTP
jgi:hypothetical protein